ncbi:hypothetical protein DP190_22415 [Enterobacter cloacae]|uniref:cag pathogenicity island Cag12 family protein n=1 Tax=Enterobacter sp. 148H3 TaxID=3077756 RepID=UPI000DCE8F5A|nr:cag pathogenicity island Cag12 family protein [Enterobacter sp. 148H3]RAY78700.1 hypothetical protein DP190_22415 [Enterobacter cloacae]
MMLPKLTGLTALAVLLAGCSSPPEPAAVDWSQPAQPVSATLPVWEPNRLIVASRITEGNWSQVLARFEPSGVYPATQWYAVAHASRAVVIAPDGQPYFAAKTWLRDGGYHGVVEYRTRTGCLTCNTSEIVFYR